MSRKRITRKILLASGKYFAGCGQTAEQLQASFDSIYNELYSLVEAQRFSMRHKDLLQVALNAWHELRLRDLEHLRDLLVEARQAEWKQISFDFSNLTSAW